MKNIVASTIRNQIGSKALYMIGAKNLTADEKSLSFKVMRNSKGVSHVKITLTSMDDYNIEFLSIRVGKIKVKSELNGIYFDQLNPTIEENTGLYTKF